LRSINQERREPTTKVSAAMTVVPAEAADHNQQRRKKI